MKVVKTIREIKKIISEQTKQDQKLGLIPTMGALHEGHLSLINRAKKTVHNKYFFTYFHFFITFKCFFHVKCFVDVI